MDGFSNIYAEELTPPEWCRKEWCHRCEDRECIWYEDMDDFITTQQADELDFM